MVSLAVADHTGSQWITCFGDQVRCHARGWLWAKAVVSETEKGPCAHQPGQASRQESREVREFANPALCLIHGPAPCRAIPFLACQ